MTRRQFTGEEVAKVLIGMGYTPVDRTGNHLKLRDEHPKTGEVRNVTVPLGGEIRIGTLRNIATQCGAQTRGAGGSTNTVDSVLTHERLERVHEIESRKRELFTRCNCGPDAVRCRRHGRIGS